MSSKKDYTIEVGSGKFAKDCTINNMFYGMQIELMGVDPDAVCDLLSADEVVDSMKCSDLLKALVKRHGLGEVLAELTDAASAESIVKELYEIDSAAVIQCVADNVSE